MADNVNMADGDAGKIHVDSVVNMSGHNELSSSNLKLPLRDETSDLKGYILMYFVDQKPISYLQTFCRKKRYPAPVLYFQVLVLDFSFAVGLRGQPGAVKYIKLYFVIQLN